MRDMIRGLVREILRRHGEAAEFPRGRTFDFLYRDELRRLLVKALTDLESLRRDLAEDLKRFSRTFEASPLVVSLKRKNEPLSEGVVYIRHSLPAVSPGTLEKALSGELPIFVDSRGGPRMFLKPEAFEVFSRSYLAEVLNVSRKAVYEYQRGLGLSASKRERVVKALGEEYVERIRIFERPVEPSEGRPKNEIDERIERIAKEFERAFRLERRPGRTALINSSLRIVLSTHKSEARVLHEKRDVIRAFALLIGRDSEVPSVSPRELEKITKDELIELVS